MTSTSPNINRWHAFALLAVSYFMTIIDLTIVNVSLPTIGRDLHFTETSLQWVVTAYAVTFGGFLLLGGRAADLLGRRRILMARACAVHGGVAGLRARDRRGVPDREPGRSGSRRGDHGARRPLDRDEHVRGGRRAQQGAWDLGRARCRRRDRRADRRRASHPLRRVAVHLLPEHPDRRSRAGARTATRPRQPARHRPPEV